MKPGRVSSVILLSVGLVYCIGGCAIFRSAHGGRSGDKLYAVRTESAPFYFHSPRPGSTPDQTIPRDTPMKLIRFSFGVCKVRLLSGEQGYVRSDDIWSAPTNMIASLDTPPAALANSSAWRAEIPQPRMDAPEPPLPEFEPTPLPEPVNPGN